MMWQVNASHAHGDWGQRFIVPMSGSNDVAYALQISGYRSEPRGGGDKFEYRVGHASGRVIAFSRSNAQRVWAAGTFSKAEILQRSGYPSHPGAPPWAR